MNASLSYLASFRKQLLLAVLGVLISISSASAQTGPQPRLHMVSVGITNAIGQGPLKATKKDAIDMEKWAKSQRGRLFSEVNARVLTNEEATRGNITMAMQSLRNEVKAGDYTIVYMSAHGGKDRQGMFNFCAYDGGLSWNVIANTLRGLPGNTIVILDTCQAGAIGKSDNLIVFSACLAAQSSRDGASENGNSLCTLFLLEALNGQADMNRNGVVSLAEMTAYVSGKLELANVNQSCTLVRPTNIPDALPLSHVGPATTNVAVQTPCPTGTCPTPPVANLATVANVAGTNWAGREDMGSLRFEFRNDGSVLMIDAVTPTPVRGTFRQQGNRVTITFGNCVYEGTINGTTLAGRAAAGQQSWSFSVQKN